MNFKDKLVSKLLDIGKKHRILVYPMLALVAVVTAISHVICWGRGNGKKMVASIMVVALLITQSLFLTSSAVNNGDDANAALTNTATDATSVMNSGDGANDPIQLLDADGNADAADDGTADAETANVTYYAYTTSSQTISGFSKACAVADSTITLMSDNAEILQGFGLDAKYFTTDGNLYSDAQCTTPIAGNQMTTTENGTYQVFVKITRTAYTLAFSDCGDQGDVASVTIPTNETNTGNVEQVMTFAVPGSDDTYHFYKRGYKYISLGDKTIGQSIEVKSSDVRTNTITVKAGWEPIKDMKLTYQLYDPSVVGVLDPVESADAVVESAAFAYGDTVSIMTLDESAYIQNKGYYFAGWKIEGTDTIIDPSQTATMAATTDSGLVKESGALTDATNVAPVKLIGQWKYKEIELYVDGNKVDGSDAAVTGMYGTAMNHVITAKYKKDGAESESIQFTNGMQAVTTGLGTYGLSVNESANSYTITGTPNNVTTDAQSYTFTVTDTNDTSKTATFNLVFAVEKLPVIIGEVKDASTGGTLTKVYDNSDTIQVQTTASVTAQDGSVPDCITNDAIQVTFDATAKMLDTGSVKGKDVGTGKTIRLTSPRLSGNNANCYELLNVEEGHLDVANAATVTKRTLNVEVAYDVDSVLFGQDSPECTLTITNPDNIAQGNNNEEQNAYAADPNTFMTRYLGLNNKDAWETNRKIYSSPANAYYYIRPTFASNGNYEVVVANPPKFSVTRESSDGYFSIKETAVGGYYPSYTIVATNGYDMVRILSDGEVDISDTMTRAQAKALFKNQSAGITADGTYTNIRFQLYNSTTNAISTIYTVKETIIVDTKIPVYVSHTVEPTGFVNQLGFGTYYHSQNNVTGMTLTVTYRSDESPCDYLHYYFAGEDASTVPTTTMQTKMVSKGNGLYEATLLVGSGYAGQLVVWATDTKQKESAHTKLVCYTTNTDASLTDKYYEWMVEGTPPTAALSVQGNGEAALTDKWYNTLDAAIAATDIDSGLDEVTWSVETPSTTVTATTSAYGANATKNAKITDYTFHQIITGGASNNYTPGEYYISAVVKDNAGNTVDVEKQGPFLFDGIKPAVTLSDDGESQTQFQSDVTITMEATEGELESGIDSIALYKDSTGSEPIQTWSAAGAKSWTESYDVTESGTYILVVTDIAGNQSTEQVTYSHISSERPDKPSVSIAKGDNGAIGNAGWLIEDKPKVTIKSTTETSDKVPVKTYYKVIYTDASGKHESQDSFTGESYTFALDGQGDVTVEAWAVSEAGCQSDTASEDAKVDIDGPAVTITDSVVDANGDVTINFQAIDLISGVDTDRVLVNGNAVSVTDTDGVAKGSFKADGSATYTIVAYDNAGNKSAEVSFEPLGLEVTPVTAITNTTAHIEAQVIQGTNPLSKSLCYIEYKKATETSYDTVLVNKTDTASGIEMIYNFSKLTPDTVYNYRVHAATLNSSEERVIEGSFKTLSGNSTTTIYGTAAYNDSLPDDVKDKPIYINLYRGNTIVGGEVVTSADNTRYMFTGVSDGTYRIVATNGTLTKEASVTVAGGMITYPETYSTTGGINFVLSGLSTDVILDDGDVEIAVDGLDKIYNNSYYKGNVTDDDLRIVQNGGRIDIALHASYIKVSDVTSEEKGIFADKLGSRTEIVRYIRLYIVKNVYNEFGNLEYSQNLTRLYEPVTISFPLEDLAGENIKVASLHAEGTDYLFKSWTDASEVTLTHDYVIINTDRFSTYALYRVTQPKTYTVVWKDGDGNILKTETVEEGASATPPEGTPTKTPTKDYTYTFEGWDQDYTNVTKDMVILAWFYSTKRDDTTEDPGTTENPGTTEQPGTTEGPKAPNANVTPGGNGANGGQNTSKNPVKYTYMGATGSPQTGDATPIVLLVCAIVFAGAGIVVTIKKRKSF